MHVSLPPLLAKKPVTTEATKTAKNVLIQVPPWGGEVYLPIIGMRTMVNICPIDNFLTIMYSLWKTSPLFYEELTRSSLFYASTLIKVFNLFNEKKIGDGKYLWLQQILGGSTSRTMLLLTFGETKKTYLFHVLEIRFVPLFKASAHRLTALTQWWNYIQHE